MTGHLLKYDSPIYNLQVFLRVISQKHSQIPSVLPDGYYGDATIKAVTAFQNMHNLSPTGITDNTTWDKIAGVYEAIEREGYIERVNIFPEEGLNFEKNNFIPTLIIVQTMLSALAERFSNLIPPDINGSFDERTHNAIVTIQRLAGLTDDGNITNEFFNVLSALYEAYVSTDRVENRR